MRDYRKLIDKLEKIISRANQLKITKTRDGTEIKINGVIIEIESSKLKIQSNKNETKRL